jgi:hypothetical protein
MTLEERAYLVEKMCEQHAKLARFLLDAETLGADDALEMLPRRAWGKIRTGSGKKPFPARALSGKPWDISALLPI